MRNCEDCKEAFKQRQSSCLKHSRWNLAAKKMGFFDENKRLDANLVNSEGTAKPEEDAAEGDEAVKKKKKRRKNKKRKKKSK